MQKTILYAVLNWGLGHATRSIPIINKLIESGNNLIIVSDGVALALLQAEFPKQQFEDTKAYQVKYASKANAFNSTLALQIPKFIQVIKAEHLDCKKICLKHKVDYIISDNRYGFHHPYIPSAFICHQLHLRYQESRIIEKILNKYHQSYLRKFTQLWVPDIAPPDNISGEMSSLKWDNVHYMGMDSRFEKLTIKAKYEYIAILSGPEPQRSLFESEITNKLNTTPGEHLIIRGTKQARDFSPQAHIKVYDMLNSAVLNELICASKKVICRSGYTSILDLLKLDKDAILVPTPGQSEQEYLAENLKTLQYFSVEKQGEIQLNETSSQKRPPLSFGYDYALILSFLSC